MRGKRGNVRSNAFIALVALLIAVVTASGRLAYGALTGAVLSAAEIGVEHRGPAILTLTIGRNAGGAGLIELTHQSDTSLWISLPSKWKLSEVRRGTLEQVKKDEPSFGFVRWELPREVIVAFALDRIPDRLTFHNASGPSLSARITTIDIPKKRVLQEVVLVKDQPTSVTLKFGRRE